MDETNHFGDMLRERNILRAWVQRAEDEPDRVENHDDGTRHFIKQIPENEGRWLRVVVNVVAFPNRRVTAFFDRRLRRIQ
jgi:hypothetical protein